MPEKEREDQRSQQDDPTKNPATSAITTDLENTPEQQADEPYVEKDPLIASGLGLVKVMGLDLRYVGKHPDADPTAQTSGGIKITSQNSTFQGINQVPFDHSVLCKDPTTNEFFYPAPESDGWMSVEYEGIKFVPPLPEPPPEGSPASRSKKKAGDEDEDDEEEKRTKADAKAKEDAKAKADADEKAKKR